MVAYTWKHDEALTKVITARGRPCWGQVANYMNEHFDDDHYTKSMVRNRWQRMHSKIRGINKCSRCGRLKRAHTCKGHSTRSKRLSRSKSQSNNLIHELHNIFGVADDHDWNQATEAEFDDADLSYWLSELSKLSELENDGL